MTVKAIPDGYHAVTPYLVVEGVDAVLAFVRDVFGAEETKATLRRPDGSIWHAEVLLGDSRVMLGEAGGAFGPLPAMLHVYVEDTDAVYKRAIAAGATSLRAPTDMFYGDRNAGVRGPGGTVWWIATHVEDVDDAEKARRAAELDQTD